MVEMMRPDWAKFAAAIAGYIACSCGRMVQSLQETREHWQAGHFDVPVTPESIRAAMAAEREACAQLAERCEWPYTPGYPEADTKQAAIAAAIRARGN